eukprot:1143968-Amphidinium_carterae.1
MSVTTVCVTSASGAESSIVSSSASSTPVLEPGLSVHYHAIWKNQKRRSKTYSKDRTTNQIS